MKHTKVAFSFDGRIYTSRKPSLDDFMRYRRRFKERNDSFRAGVPLRRMRPIKYDIIEFLFSPEAAYAWHRLPPQAQNAVMKECSRARLAERAFETMGRAYFLAAVTPG